MKFEILLDTSINKPQSQVWQVLSDLDKYAEWNPFVKRCESSLAEGEAIIMWVKLLPFILRQKETIRRNDGAGFMEYGIHIPGLLHSTRQHILSADNAQSCHYHSVFRLEGILAPVVGAMLGKQLRKGFSSMTEAVKTRTESL